MEEKLYSIIDMNDNLKVPKDKKWKYCPNCGQEIPKIQYIKYCIKCGLNFSLVNKKDMFHSNEIIISSQHEGFLLQRDDHKLSDEEIYDTKDRQLWGIGISIVLPVLSLILMTIISVVFMIIYIFANFNLFTVDIDVLYTIIEEIYLDNNFMILLSVLELIFIITPLIYIKKYLKKPSLKNRLALLGFTTKGFGKKKIIKEIGIGLLFAVMGLIFIMTLSFLMELLIPSIQSSEMDALLFSSLNAIQLILFIFIMIFIVGTSEEILFRGFMQKGLVRSRLGIKGGIVLSAFLFAMIHVVMYLYDLVYFFVLFVPYFAISLLLGWLYHWRDENLIAVMITHGVYNALILILIFLI